jgi:hypothetical protein
MYAVLSKAPSLFFNAPYSLFEGRIRALAVKYFTVDSRNIMLIF